MFDRILIPLDGSLPATSALYAGERLADRWDAEITILTLLSKTDTKFGLDEVVKRQADRIGRRRSVELRTLSYSVPDDIAAEFDAVPNTLVVMSTWARGRTAVLAGNVAEEVLRLTRRPMLLLGPTDEVGEDWPSGPMLVCTDGSEFADYIVPHAARWAENLELEPIVVGVVDPSDIPAGAVTPSESNALARVAHEIEEITGREVNFDTLHGSEPADAIVDYAKRSGASLIALATHGRTKLGRMLHDSIAMEVVREAGCPVLVGRPPLDPLR